MSKLARYGQCLEACRWVGRKGARRIVVGAERCIGAWVHTVGGYRRDDSDSDTCRRSTRLVRVEAGAYCNLSTEPTINPERIGLDALRIFHRLFALRQIITRRYYSTSMGRRTAYEGLEKSTTASQRWNNGRFALHCMIILCPRLLADWLVA